MWYCATVADDGFRGAQPILRMGDATCRPVGCVERLDPHQITRHSGRVSAIITNPVSPAVAVAHGAPIASASQPSATNPTGPMPMHTDRTPSMRLRISGGDDR